MSTQEPRVGPGTYERLDVELSSAGTRCAAWLYLPHGAAQAPVPAVALAPGLGSLKEMGLAPLCEALASTGIAALVFDYRHWGASDGTPREHLIPNDQVDDYRNALTYLGLRPEVDANRLGTWGVSLSGGHVLQLSAYDARVKAVVSVTPAIDIYADGRKRFAPEMHAAFASRFAEERARLYQGGEHRYVPLAKPDQADGAVMGTASYEWQEAYRTSTVPQFRNRITLHSLEMLGEYSPGLSIERIAPTPLLLVLATEDATVDADLTRAAFDRAGEPKRLLELTCGHYDVYRGEHQASMLRASVAWFAAHL